MHDLLAEREIVFELDDTAQPSSQLALVEEYFPIVRIKKYLLPHCNAQSFILEIRWKAQMFQLGTESRFPLKCVSTGPDYS